MNFLGTPEFKVGLLVVIVSVLVAAMSMKVSEDPSYLGSSKRLWFVVDDASGLVKKSPVRVAGIRVGIIEDIILQKGLARVNMIVRSEVLLTKSSKIEIRANGILGDKHVEIIPGSSNDPQLASGEQIMVVEDNASIDRLVSEVSKITKSLGEVVDNIRDATEGDDSKPIGKIVKNIEKLTSDVSQLVADKKGEVAELIDRLNNIAGTIDELVNDESDQGFKATWKRTMVRVENSMENIEGITGKINKGEGTIGRLVNDEQTVEELNTAISGINNFIQAGAKIQTSFDYYAHYLTEIEGVRNYFGIKIQPGLDRFYEIAAVDAPEGVSERFTQTLTPDGGTAVTTTEDKTHFNRVALSLLFGKNFYNFSIKGGIIENQGGVGLEYNFWRNRFKAQLDLFNLSEPNVRGYVRYNFFKGLYVVGGQQFIFADEGDTQSAFIGAGLFLTNDDIKVMLSRINF